LIKIYTLSGDLVTEFIHDAATYNGSDIKWFQNFSGLGVSPQFAGGEHAWDLISKYDQAIATGLYLFTVKDLATGNINNSKALIAELEMAQKAGVTKYTKVAIRLEPDTYCYQDGNTEQGWWDDAHWQKAGYLTAAGKVAPKLYVGYYAGDYDSPIGGLRRGAF